MEASKLNRYDERKLYQYGGSKGNIKKKDTEGIHQNNEVLLKEYRILIKKYENLKKDYDKLKEKTKNNS